MGPGDIVVKGDKLQKLLLLAKTQLIRVPPPCAAEEGGDGTAALLDIGHWALDQPVWRGTVRFVEEERLGGDGELEGMLEGVVELLNGAEDDNLFTEIRFTSYEDVIRSTKSPRVFRVIIEHQGSRYVLGLVFADKDTGNAFTAALVDFKKDLAVMKEALSEQIEDLNGSVDKLSIHSDDDEFGDFVEG